MGKALLQVDYPIIYMNTICNAILFIDPQQCLE